MHDAPPPLLDLDPLERSLPELRARYADAAPFPHVVLDDVLVPGALDDLLAEFEAIPSESWTNYLHLNERKFGHTKPDLWGPRLQQLRDELMSDRFVRLVAGLTGFDDLHADDVMDGGGLHRSLPGGFLNVHADFTAHHSKPGWRRRVNLLLYLNPTWDESWGGELELWSRDMKRCVTTVAPLGSRILLFTTDTDAYHGHPTALRFPPGESRRSLALYYFTIEDSVPHRSTDYRARPGDGARSALIYVDKMALRGYDVVKRGLRLSDGAVSRALGTLSRRSRR